MILNTATHVAAVLEESLWEFLDENSRTGA